MFSCSLALRSCFLVNPCTAPRSSTRLAGAGPFTRTSIRRIFGSALLRDCLRDCLIASSAGGGRPLSSRSKRLATAVVLSFVRRDHQPLRFGVDVIGVDVVSVDRNGLVIAFD